jgi:hypothetical protein
MTIFEQQSDATVIAPFTVERTCNRSMVEGCLILSFSPGEWGMIDHATFCHGDRIAQLTEAAGRQGVYLRLYFPFFS